MTTRDILMAAAGAGEDKTYVEDVFSTYLYTGGSTPITVNNGIDLAGKGGLIWIKNRNNSSQDLNHYLIDTVRGINNNLTSNSTAAQAAYGLVSSVSSTGYADACGWNSSTNAVSWTFRKAPKFFDVVTWTGNGVAGRTISHSLGQVPGMIIVKRTDTSADWQVYHRSLANTRYMVLNTTAAAATGATRWNSTTPTASVFSLGTDASVNASGGSYVAYLFAHDTTADGLIQCGSFTTNGSGNATVNLGWEPQYVLIKASSDASHWFISDIMRGSDQTTTQQLEANLSAQEYAASTGQFIIPTATGFDAKNQAGNTTYIYMAIRRPMKVPTDGTKVFAPLAYSGNGGNNNQTTNFPVDLGLVSSRNASYGFFAVDRLRGNQRWPLNTNSTAAETNIGGGYIGFDSNTEFRIISNGINRLNGPGTTYILEGFRRAPGFFDVVCYTGNGSTTTQSHNLGVAPTLMIIKGRTNTTDGWPVYTGPSTYLKLNTTESTQTWDSVWNNTAPTSTVFTVGGTGLANENTMNYVAYLFASCPGVSKVGSYTGNGSSQTINCGFAAGARFVLIKRTDSTGDWYVWDTARGIVAGNDPHLSLNTTAAEVTTNDTIDPDSTGFIVNQVAATNVNVNGASYIYLAIA